jgi:hypothetical protein
MAGPLIVGGALLYVGGALYGIIRANTYHRPGSVVALNKKSPWGLTLVSDKRGNLGMKASYTLRY